LIFGSAGFLELSFKITLLDFICFSDILIACFAFAKLGVSFQGESVFLSTFAGVCLLGFA
jgi:hypothetical protein